MATLHTKTGATGIEFGIGADEGSLITNKVSMARKTKKKDLRGRQGGYKSVCSFGKTLEVSIEGALVGPAPGTTGFTLGASHTLDEANDTFALGITLYVESVTLTEKNDDFKKGSIKLIGSDSIG